MARAWKAVRDTGQVPAQRLNGTMLPQSQQSAAPVMQDGKTLPTAPNTQNTPFSPPSSSQTQALNGTIPPQYNGSNAYLNASANNYNMPIFPNASPDDPLYNWYGGQLPQGVSGQMGSLAQALAGARNRNKYNMGY